jgi:hypothetical protein
MSSVCTVLAAFVVVLTVGPAAPSAAPPVALLTRVVVSSSAGVDRVSFRFRSRPATVQPRFVSRAALVAVSGRLVHVAGSAFLVVVMRPASGVDLAGSVPMVTYRGAKRIRPAATQHVREVVELEDFEAVLRWAVGLDARHAYSIARTRSEVALTIR